MPAETMQAEAAPAETAVDKSPKAQPRGERVPRTGNVRLLTEAAVAESTEAADTAAGTAPAAAAKATPKPAAKAVPKATAKAAPKTPAAKAAPKASRAKAAPEATTPGPVPEAPVGAVPEAPAGAKPEAPVGAVPDTPAGAAAAGEPLPSYSELSIASIRARLRNLSADQVRELVVYEKAHAARADFITTFERRIVKLESEDS